MLEYQTKLARYLRRMVGDTEVALDLTQEVFLSAYRMLRADPERESLMRAGSIARRRMPESHFFVARKFCACCRSTVKSIAATWRVDERSAASSDLQAALARLAPDQSAALLLTSYAGYSSSEAATILGTTSDAVRQRVCRAMRVLRGL